MKKQLYLIILSAFAFSTITLGQSRLVVFTENGDRFFLYINGKLQNGNLESNVTTKNITEEGITMRVVFDKEGVGEKLFKLPLKPGYQTNCALKINQKGEYIIAFAGESPLQDNSSDPEPQQTTTSSSSSNSQLQNQTSSTIPQGCPTMADQSFEDAKLSVKSKSFDQTKIIESKQILDANCLSSKQIKVLLSVLSFEDSRLEVAKYAYTRCSDQNNYYQVTDAFQFETSISELNAYIKSKK